MREMMSVSQTFRSNSDDEKPDSTSFEFRRSVGKPATLAYVATISMLEQSISPHCVVPRSSPKPYDDGDAKALTAADFPLSSGRRSRSFQGFEFEVAVASSPSLRPEAPCSTPCSPCRHNDFLDATDTSLGSVETVPFWVAPTFKLKGTFSQSFIDENNVEKHFESLQGRRWPAPSATLESHPTTATATTSSAIGATETDFSGHCPRPADNDNDNDNDNAAAAVHVVANDRELDEEVILAPAHLLSCHEDPLTPTDDTNACESGEKASNVDNPTIDDTTNLITSTGSNLSRSSSAGSGSGSRENLFSPQQITTPVANMVCDLEERGQYPSGLSFHVRPSPSAPLLPPPRERRRPNDLGLNTSEGEDENGNRTRNGNRVRNKTLFEHKDEPLY